MHCILNILDCWNVCTVVHHCTKWCCGLRAPTTTCYMLAVWQMGSCLKFVAKISQFTLRLLAPCNSPSRSIHYVYSLDKYHIVKLQPKTWAGTEAIKIVNTLGGPYPAIKMIFLYLMPPKITTQSHKQQLRCLLVCLCAKIHSCKPTVNEVLLSKDYMTQDNFFKAHDSLWLATTTVSSLPLSHAFWICTVAFLNVSWVKLSPNRPTSMATLPSCV